MTTAHKGPLLGLQPEEVADQDMAPLVEQFHRLAQGGGKFHVLEAFAEKYQVVAPVGFQVLVLALEQFPLATQFFLYPPGKVVAGGNAIHPVAFCEQGGRQIAAPAAHVEDRFNPFGNVIDQMPAIIFLGGFEIVHRWFQVVRPVAVMQILGLEKKFAQGQPGYQSQFLRADFFIHGYSRLHPARSRNCRVICRRAFPYHIGRKIFLRCAIFAGSLASHSCRNGRHFNAGPSILQAVFGVINDPAR